jgi:hypothetical protein
MSGFHAQLVHAAVQLACSALDPINGCLQQEVTCTHQLENKAPECMAGNSMNTNLNSGWMRLPNIGIPLTCGHSLFTSSGGQPLQLLHPAA